MLYLYESEGKCRPLAKMKGIGSIFKERCLHPYFRECLAALFLLMRKVPFHRYCDAPRKCHSQRHEKGFYRLTSSHNGTTFLDIYENRFLKSECQK